MKRKKEKKNTDDSGHLRRQATNAGLMNIKTFPVIAHAIDIDDRHLPARCATVSVHGRMCEPPLHGPVDGRPAHRSPCDRLVDQNSSWDRDLLGRSAQDEIGGKEGLKLEGKRMGMGIDEARHPGRMVRIG